MNSRYLTRVVLLTLLAQSAISSYAPAQTVIPPQKRRGIASSLAMGFIDDRDMSRIWISPPGSIGPAVPADQITFPASVPDYGTAFSDFPGIEIDALSTGNDFIGATTTTGSQPEVGGADLESPPRWQAFAVTVQETAQGTSPSSILPMIDQMTGGTQGTIISHYMRGSTAAIPAGYRDTTHAEQLPVNIWGQASVPSPVPEIVAQDFALGALAYATGPTPTMMPQSVVFQNGMGKLYFSVTKAYAQAYGIQPGATPPTWDPAAVYVRSWDTTQTPSAWSTVAVEISSFDLGLDSDDDLDALAYDKASNNPVAVYSTQVPLQGDSSQLYLYGGTPVPTGTLVPYHSLAVSNGTASSQGSLMDKLTVDETSNVTSACSIDPGNEMGLLIDQVVGLPVLHQDASNGMMAPLGFSMCRSSYREVMLQATGRGDLPDCPGDLVFGAIEYFNGTSWTILPGSVQPENVATGECEWPWDISGALATYSVPAAVNLRVSTGQLCGGALTVTSSDVLELYLP